MRRRRSGLRYRVVATFRPSLAVAQHRRREHKDQSSTLASTVSRAIIKLRVVALFKGTAQLRGNMDATTQAPLAEAPPLICGITPIPFKEGGRK